MIELESLQPAQDNREVIYYDAEEHDEKLRSLVHIYLKLGLIRIVKVIHANPQGMAVQLHIPGITRGNDTREAILKAFNELANVKHLWEEHRFQHTSEFVLEDLQGQRIVSHMGVLRLLRPVIKTVEAYDGSVHQAGRMLRVTLAKLEKKLDEDLPLHELLDVVQTLHLVTSGEK